MKSENGFLWIAGGVAAAIGLMICVSDLPSGFFDATPAKPVAGKVYELTADNLSAARRNTPVLVALFTARGNTAGSRMARGLHSLAQRVRDRAIVAVGNLDDEPELAGKAGVAALPVWVIYANGEEVSRATGENADLSVDRLLAEQTGPPP
jgi:thioredoxin-like negative regulator of GroEL